MEWTSLFIETDETVLFISRLPLHLGSNKDLQEDLTYYVKSNA